VVAVCGKLWPSCSREQVAAVDRRRLLLEFLSLKDESCAVFQQGVKVMEVCPWGYVEGGGSVYRIVGHWVVLLLWSCCLHQVWSCIFWKEGIKFLSREA
jgi:hypothetical protein